MPELSVRDMCPLFVCEVQVHHSSHLVFHKTLIELGTGIQIQNRIDQYPIMLWL
jgi:hypothetical protein